MNRKKLRAVLTLLLSLPLCLLTVLADGPTATSTNKWEQSVAVGLTLTKGNSDTILGNVNYLGSKKWAQNEIRLGADGSYGENSGLVNNEAAKASAQYNRLFSERLYGYFKLEGLHDGVADIAYRLTLAPGAGYYILKSATNNLSVEAGPAIVIEKQGGTEAKYFTMRLAERFEQKLTARARVWQSLEFLPQLDDLGNFIINAEVGAEASLTKSLSLRIVVVDTFDNVPAPGREENDLKLVSGVAYHF